MTRFFIPLSAVLAAALLVPGAMAQKARIYNTAKLKLQAGKQIVGGTVSTTDPEIFCAMANAGWDFLWIEMQHSPLNYQTVATMMRACKGAPAIPFVRVPDATEGDIQKAISYYEDPHALIGKADFVSEFNGDIYLP